MDDYITPDFVQQNAPKKTVAAPSTLGNFFQENKMMIIIFGVIVVIVVLLLIWVMTREKKMEPNRRPPPGNQNPAGGGLPNNTAQQPAPQQASPNGVPPVPPQGVPNMPTQPVAQQQTEAKAPAIKQLIKTNIETVDDNELNKFMNLGEEELDSSDDKDNVDEGDFDNLDVESSD